jgi:hypothetical protein
MCALPGIVSHLGPRVFEDCDSLFSVTFLGTASLLQFAVSRSTSVIRRGAFARTLRLSEVSFSPDSSCADALEDAFWGRSCSALRCSARFSASARVSWETRDLSRSHGALCLRGKRPFFARRRRPLLRRAHDWAVLRSLQDVRRYLRRRLLRVRGPEAGRLRAPTAPRRDRGSIPATVRTIGECAFAHCRALAVVDFPDDADLAALGANAFADHSS